MSYTEKREEVDALKQQIEAHGELSPDVKKKINYKFRLDWNYYSNSMEGNTLTMDETRSVMIGNLTVGGKPIKDVLEVKGHDEVIADILKIGKGDVRLSETRIRDIHKGIMYEDDAAKRHLIGRWKSEPNYVINYKGERFDFVSPADVPQRMHDLLNRTNAAIDAIVTRSKDAPHPLDIALQFHLDYVLIHPFYDGNGRTARILTNLLLISFGYTPFWVKTDERRIYNQYIADIQGYSGGADVFFDFAAGLIIRSQRLVLDAIEGKSIEEEEDIDKEIDLFKKSLSRKNESNKIKSVEHIHSILRESGTLLFKKLVDTLSRFDDLFHETEIRFLHSDREDIKYDIKKRMGGFLAPTITDYLPETLIDWLKKRSDIDYTIFGMEVYWKGYKLSTPAFDVGVYVYFGFDKYSYHMFRDATFNSLDHYFEKSYEEQLSKDDIQFTVTNVVTDIMNYIKENHFEAE